MNQRKKAAKPTPRYMSPKVTGPMVSRRDNAKGPDIRWVCYWKDTSKVAQASEWVPDDSNGFGEKWVRRMIREIDAARRKAGVGEAVTLKEAEILSKLADLIGKVAKAAHDVACHTDGSLRARAVARLDSAQTAA